MIVVAWAENRDRYGQSRGQNSWHKNCVIKKAHYQKEEDDPGKSIIGF